MSGFAAGSLSNTQSRNNQRVWEHQGGALNNLYGAMSGLFQGTNQGMWGQIGNAVNQNNQTTNQARPAWQNQLNGGATAGMGLQKQLGQSLENSLNGPSASQEINNMIMGGEGNNYADAMKDQYVNDANRASDNMMSNLDARAAASGMSGGSRHGMATAQGMEGINRNLQRNMAETGYNTFDKDLDRKLQIAGQADQGTLARQNMMSNMLGQQNQAQVGAVNQGSQMQNLGMGAFAPFMAPWQAAGAYGQGVGGPTVLSSGNSSGKSFGTSTGGGK